MPVHLQSLPLILDFLPDHPTARGLQLDKNFPVLERLAICSTATSGHMAPLSTFQVLHLRLRMHFPS